jgi:cytoskeletal protein RodZ
MATVLRRDPIVQLGEFLRAARERAGLTLQQVSTTTKIPWRHLDAIEHGDLSVVPKGPYRRGEVRAFAQAVGVDQKVALAQLEEALPAAPPEMPVPPVEAIEPRSSWIAVTSVLTAVVCLIALLIWNRQPASPQDPVPAPPPSAPSASAQGAVAHSAAESPSVSVPIVGAPATEPQTPVLPPVHPVLVVSSDPSGARVVVDDIGRGTTPTTIEFLSFGEHRVRIVRDGYVSDERSITLTAKRPTTTLQVDLRPSR